MLECAIANFGIIMTNVLNCSFVSHASLGIHYFQFVVLFVINCTAPIVSFVSFEINYNIICKLLTTLLSESRREAHACNTRLL